MSASPNKAKKIGINVKGDPSLRTYTYSEARQNLATVLDKAKQEGEIIIKRRDGSNFVVRPIANDKSPLDIEGIDTGITSEEIAEIIHEIRRR